MGSMTIVRNNKNLLRDRNNLFEVPLETLTKKNEEEKVSEMELSIYELEQRSKRRYKQLRKIKKDNYRKNIYAVLMLVTIYMIIVLIKN